MSRAVGSRLWHTRRAAVLLLALTSAVLFVLLVSDEQFASAQTSPGVITRAWGINSFGQLGDDSTAPRSKQVEVKGEGGVGSLGSVTSFDGGQNHTVALKNGTAYAWGHNGSGQLGTGPISGTGTDSDVPVKVHGAGDVGFLTDVLAVAAGSNFSLALVSDGTGDGVGNDGTVWAWGDNFRGQLGNNSLASSNVPVQVHGAGNVGFLTHVVAVAAGGSHSLAVKSDGTVWTWGDNQFGQLGDGNSGLNAQSKVPVQVKDVGGSGSLTGVSSVAGGGLHSLVLKSDGTVYAWGYNGTGGLGNGGGPDSSTPVQVKGENGVGSLTGATDIAAGGEHSLAIKDGNVYAWGYNFYGQLGNGGSGNSANSNVPVKVKGEGGVGFLTGATDVAAGAHHSLAASTSGTVWAWGRNDFGPLGNGSFGGTQATPVQAIQLIGTTQVASGDFHSLAVSDADTTPPDTTIDPNSVPPANTSNTSASFVFSSPSTDVAGFECRRDGELFTSCISPKNYADLPDGSHTFHVRAKDVAGNVDSSPASHAWTVDTVAPAAPSITAPADNSFDNDGAFDVSGTAEANSAVTIFEGANPVGTATADGSGDWSKGLGGVAEGSHTYTAKATDAANNTSLESNARTVKVDVTAPALDTGNSDSVTPDNLARNVSRRTNVLATFSENLEMNAATLVTSSTVQVPGAFTLVNTKTGATVDAVVSCDDPCLTVTLDPMNRLARRTTYRAEITTAAEDLAGNPLGEVKSWTFKTKRR
jgi:alpha-tubulin suppressor-like RCC1 family protein